MVQHLSTLFSSLENIKKTTELDEKYKISELTLAQQRELIVSVFDPFETPAKLGIAFNNIINSCVETITGTNKDITIIEKPMLLRALRDLTIGNQFTKKIIDDEGNEKTENYQFNILNPKAFHKIKKEKEIHLDGVIKITLCAPTLSRDSEVNKTIIQKINNYRRNLESKHRQPDPGEIAAQYLICELTKYIKSIQINEEIFNFTDLIVDEQIKVINSLPQEHINKITDFIEEVKKGEELAFTATNLKTKKQEKISIEHNIFSKEL